MKLDIVGHKLVLSLFSSLWKPSLIKKSYTFQKHAKNVVYLGKKMNWFSFTHSRHQTVRSECTNVTLVFLMKASLIHFLIFCKIFNLA